MRNLLDWAIFGACGVAAYCFYERAVEVRGNAYGVFVAIWAIVISGRVGVYLGQLRNEREAEAEFRRLQDEFDVLMDEADNNEERPCSNG